MKIRQLLLCLCIVSLGFPKIMHAQISVEESMTRKHPECRDLFLNAIDVIPDLYKKQELDSLQKAIDIWKTYCGDITQVKYVQMLLDIERSTYSVTVTGSDLIPLLTTYAQAYSNSVKYAAYYGEQSRFYKMTAGWAKLLLQKDSLTETEKFICNVFAGNITQPVNTIKEHKNDYDSLSTMVNEDLVQQKKRGNVELTFISGVWVPTGHASLLGVHPSIGFQFGGRHNRHQVDFTMQFRFLKSAGTYSVKRSNNLYDLDYYLGGYLGIDYNYYFINHTKTDFGIIAGAGYDGFDIANSDNNHSNDYLKPLSISSFNFNTGLRFNYIFKPTFYIGLQARYHFIHYNNSGGSNLSGNDFSVDLILGFTHPPPSMR